MATPRRTLTTAEISLTAPTALMMEDIKTFYVQKYALSLERMTLSQSVDLLQVTCVCKFGKRQKVYLHTVAENLNGRQVQAETKNFASRHLQGEFDQHWKGIVSEASDPRNRVMIWSSPEYQQKNPIQKIVEMEDINAALLEIYTKDPKKAIGSGLATNHKNIKVIKEVLHANSLPEFEWDFPEHLLSTTTCYLAQEELDFLRRWFVEECEPAYKDRRKALVLFSEGREYGKSTFARSLVSGIEDYYIEIGGVSMTEKNFVCKTKARLFVVDDMEIDLRKYLEMWKKLLSSQRVNLRDCYFNQEFPGGIPVVMTTNNKKIFLQLAKSPLFYDQCYFLTLSEFMGPLNCKPSALQDDRETKRQKYHCGKHREDLSPIADAENSSTCLAEEGENSNDSERFKDAIKKEEWSSCYKSCSENEKQVLLTKFAELNAEMEKMKSLYFKQQQQPAPTINVFNIFNRSVPHSNTTETRSAEISYIKNQVQHHYPEEEEKKQYPEEEYPYDLEPTIRKKQHYLQQKEEGQDSKETMRKSLFPIVEVNQRHHKTSIPGVTFDGKQLSRVTIQSREFLSMLKLRKLLSWSQKKEKQQQEEAAAKSMLSAEEEKKKKSIEEEDWDDPRRREEEYSKDRYSFALFSTYLLCCKKTDIRIQEDEELVVCETSYFTAKRMKRSNQGAFSRLYARAYYENPFNRGATKRQQFGTGTMQTFEKQRRAYLCEDLYWDVDQVNSHPSLLLSLLNLLDVAVPKLLQEYVQDRDGILAQIATSYETSKTNAKNLIIRLMYGGSVKNWVATHKLGFPSDEELDQKLIWFAEELYSLNEKLQKIPLLATAVLVYHATYEKTERTATSFLSLICGEYERQVLLFVKQWLSQQTPPRHLDVLIHDGGLMRRLPRETEPPRDLLAVLNQAIKRNFKTPHINYEYKDFNNVLSKELRTEIDQEEPYYF